MSAWAHKKLSFWQMISPPKPAREIGMIFPGYGAEKATFAGRSYVLTNEERCAKLNKLSPRGAAENVP